MVVGYCVYLYTRIVSLRVKYVHYNGGYAIMINLSDDYGVLIATVDFFFFFQAEDGIRDLYVTGVQTCALPISLGRLTGRLERRVRAQRRPGDDGLVDPQVVEQRDDLLPEHRHRVAPHVLGPVRSEERRVGKECRSQWAADHGRIIMKYEIEEIR